MVHGLNPSEAWDLIVPAEDKAERAKILKYHTLCEATTLDLVHIGMNTFGSFGTQGQVFLGKLFTRYVKRCASEGEQRYPGQLQNQCWERVSVALHKAIAQQLCGAFALLGPADEY